MDISQKYRNYMNRPEFHRKFMTLEKKLKNH